MIRLQPAQLICQLIIEKAGTSLMVNNVFHWGMKEFRPEKEQ